MSTCSNCSAPVKYEYRVADALIASYCDAHLPRFLYPQKKIGALTPKPVEITAELPKASKKKTAVVEDAPTEE
jgi:hypothetical protein